jgi:hypothetical protein
MSLRTKVGTAAVAALSVLALAQPAQAAPVAPVTASLAEYCLWNNAAANFTTSVRAFGSSSRNAAFSVWRDNVKVGVFYAPRPGWWLETTPTGSHAYEVRDYAGTTTLAQLSPVTGGVCTPA